MTTNANSLEQSRYLSLPERLLHVTYEINGRVNVTLEVGPFYSVTLASWFDTGKKQAVEQDNQPFLTRRSRQGSF